MTLHSGVLISGARSCSGSRKVASKPRQVPRKCLQIALSFPGFGNRPDWETFTAEHGRLYQFEEFLARAAKFRFSPRSLRLHAAHPLRCAALRCCCVPLGLVSVYLRLLGCFADPACAGEGSGGGLRGVQGHAAELCSPGQRSRSRPERGASFDLTWLSIALQSAFTLTVVALVVIACRHLALCRTRTGRSQPLPKCRSPSGRNFTGRVLGMAAENPEHVS